MSLVMTFLAIIAAWAAVAVAMLWGLLRVIHRHQEHHLRSAAQCFKEGVSHRHVRLKLALQSPETAVTDCHVHRLGERIG